jgi:hypothetical protein
MESTTTPQQPAGGATPAQPLTMDPDELVPIGEPVGQESTAAKTAAETTAGAAAEVRSSSDGGGVKVKIRVDNRPNDLVEFDSRQLRRVASVWTQIVRNRDRWAGVGASDSDIETLNREVWQSLLVSEKQFAEMVEGLVGAECVVEVSIAHAPEDRGWEARVFPWEVFLTSILKPLRGGRRLFVVRHLDGLASTGGADTDRAMLFVESAPGKLRPRWSFDRERLQMKSSLDGHRFELERDPSRETLASRVATVNPELIHFTGLDTWQGAANLELPPSTDRRDGVLLAKPPIGVDEVNADDLARLLTSGAAKPRLVAFNCYNSGAQLAAAAVACGAITAIGFQDVIDDVLAETFFSFFYRALSSAGSTVESAFVKAHRALQAVPSQMAGSGVVMWRRRSIKDFPISCKALSEEPGATPMEAAKPPAQSPGNAASAVSGPAVEAFGQAGVAGAVAGAAAVAGAVAAGMDLRVPNRGGDGRGVRQHGSGWGLRRSPGTGPGGTGRRRGGRRLRRLLGTGPGGTGGPPDDATGGSESAEAIALLEFDDIVPFKQLNYSMLHNNRGLFKSFTLRARAGATAGVDGVIVRVELYVGTASPNSWDETVSVPCTNPLLLHDEIRLPLISEMQRGLKFRLRTILKVMVTHINSAGERHIHQKSYPVELLAMDEWRDDDAERHWLPSFVMPDDPMVRQVIDTAQRYLTALVDRGDAAFDAYQRIAGLGETPNQAVDPQVKAIWTSLWQDHALKYISEPPTHTKASQRLRSPSGVISGHRGTCIDLALLLASCLEWVQIYPVIFLLKGHALPGYWRDQDAHRDFIRGLVPDDRVGTAPPIGGGTGGQGPRAAWTFDRAEYYPTILAHIEAGALVPIEATELTGKEGFWKALGRGEARVRDVNRFQTMMDVRLARLHGVTPLPVFTGE